ncbi:hypothetical protein K2173_005659 [Erythroxylum novogranatense]|uniref:Glutaredoxin domain-containing protein n=1 Tax=Erythroxylum novogranatense TaxID=1862640 RepID=A0AAV8SQM1_9ROSI|nr:hypothetical protein K2173_005659 [Erythroxylum novogranatense]
MKSVKGRLLRKLKFTPSKNTLKQGLVSNLNITEKFSSQNLHLPSLYIQVDHKKGNLHEVAAGNTSLSHHIRDLKDEELDLELHVCDELNTASYLEANDKVPAIDNSESLGTAEITAEYYSINEAEVSEECPSLSDFEEKCPPGGTDSVIFYSTSLRSIRKTFEDCHTIRFLLESFKVRFFERDVSIHLEFRDELWRLLGCRVIPPRLFIKGRDIGGADEVVSLHEQGKLKKLLEGIPLSLSSSPCTGCGNLRFVVCSDCNGSRKIYTDMVGEEMQIRCPECNENGLVKCPICS